MLEPSQVRALPLLNRAVEATPALQACCGACRTCIATNVLTLALAGITGGAVALARVAKRLSRSAP